MNISYFILYCSHWKYMQLESKSWRLHLLLPYDIRRVMRDSIEVSTRRSNVQNNTLILIVRFLLKELQHLFASLCYTANIAKMDC